MVHPKNKQDLLQIPAYPILSLFSQYVTTPWSSPPKNGIHLLKQNKHHRSNPQLYPPKPTPCPFPENAWVFHLANDYQN